MPICPFCSEMNPAGVEVCQKCGNPLPREEATAGEPTALDQQILELLKSGKTIEAIKVYRSQTGQGLKEAKDAVEALAAKYGIASKGAGCASMVLIALLLPVAWRIFG
jgi:ribosomal protein L7/L12